MAEVSTSIEQRLSDKFRARLMIRGVKYTVTFATEAEARDWIVVTRSGATNDHRPSTLDLPSRTIATLERPVGHPVCGGGAATARGLMATSRGAAAYSTSSSAYMPCTKCGGPPSTWGGPCSVSAAAARYSPGSTPVGMKHISA